MDKPFNIGELSSVIQFILKLVYSQKRKAGKSLPSDEEFIKATMEGACYKFRTRAHQYSNNIELPLNTNLITDIEKITTQLDIQMGRVSSLNSKTLHPKLVQEVEILKDKRNYCLLGHVGSGKTTTIKRLIQEICLNPKEYSYRTPILLTLKSLNSQGDLFSYMTKELGFAVKKVERNNVSDSFRLEVKKELSTDVFVVEFLSSINSVLFLDGLDEIIEIEKRTIVLGQIMELARKVSNDRLKIFLTARSGTININMGDFVELETLPLNPMHQSAIISKLLGTDIGRKFQNAMKSSPIKDLIDSPLFLMFIIISFHNSGGKKMPNSLHELLENVVNLQIEEWDKKRGIERIYSDFNTNEKAAFLVHLSYHLTFSVQSNEFNIYELKEAYKKIYPDFNLKLEDQNSVINELVNHTGIVQLTYGDTYSFRHLSIQEHLCGKYLSTCDVYSDDFRRCLKISPDAVAMSIGISYNPSEKLAVILEAPSLRDELTNGIMINIMYRLIKTRPRFKLSKDVGLSLINYLNRRSDGKDLTPFEKQSFYTVFEKLLLSSPILIDSILNVLETYDLKDSRIDNDNFDSIISEDWIGATNYNNMDVSSYSIIKFIPEFIVIKNTYYKIILKAKKKISKRIVKK